MKKLAPLVTAILLGIAIWVCDASLFAYANPKVTVLGALFTQVSLFRLALRLFVFVLLVFLGGLKAYALAERSHRNLGLMTEEQVQQNLCPQIRFCPDSAGEGIVRIIEPTPTELPPTFEPLLAYTEKIKQVNAAVEGTTPPSRAAAAVLPQATCEKQPVTAPARAARSSKKSQKNTQKLGDNAFYSAALWQYAGRLGEALRLNEQELNALRVACYCYHLGTFGVGDEQEPALGEVNDGALSAHCEIGARIAEALPELAPAAEIIRHHHERYNGSGLLGLAGLEIPLGSRIFAVAWVYNALIRPDGGYHLQKDDALATLYQYGGTALDPELVAVFINNMSKHKLYVENRKASLAAN